MTQYYHTIFNEKMTQEEMISLEERVKNAIAYEKSLNDEQKAKLHDYSDVEKMMHGIMK